MDLFEHSLQENKKNLPGVPLAEILRPQNIKDLIGQSKVIEHINHYIQTGFLPNLIFWGPPGTGKTTLAESLANHFDFIFLSVNAAQSGAKELREIGEKAKKNRIEIQKRTLLFVDEVHRFNKSQQDVLLPYIEKGDLTLIGATTENPSYELNKAILSRCRLLVFERLTETNLETLALKAIQYLEIPSAQLSPEALQYLVHWSDGDARRLLNALEEIGTFIKTVSNTLTSNDSTNEMSILSLEKIKDILGTIVLGHDKSSDSHYDLISALIKSVRGSDPDASLYYLARLLKGAENPLFICRRLIILASEDIGNAEPRALPLAVSAFQAVEILGLPEASITLSHLVCFLASSPKSNRTYLGLKKAQSYVEQTGSLPVPLYLRSAQTREMKNLGYGLNYQYPHDFPRHWVAQNYFPETAKDIQKFYEPDDIGFEKNLKDYLSWLHQKTR